VYLDGRDRRLEVAKQSSENIADELVVSKSPSVLHRTHNRCLTQHISVNDTALNDK